jgi:transcriptional/translational regulatory protein YebC/TACO1
MAAALEASAEDIETSEDCWINVTTTPESFTTMKEVMFAAGLETDMAEVIIDPSTSVELNLDQAEKIMRLIDLLEDLDDVQNVYTNADFSDEVMQQLV